MNDQFPMTNDQWVTDEVSLSFLVTCRYRTSMQHWSVHIGHWSFLGHWSLAIGHSDEGVIGHSDEGVIGHFDEGVDL